MFYRHAAGVSLRDGNRRLSYLFNFYFDRKKMRKVATAEHCIVVDMARDRCCDCLWSFRQVRERLQALGALLPMTIFLRQEIDRIQQVRIIRGRELIVRAY